MSDQDHIKKLAAEVLEAGPSTADERFTMLVNELISIKMMLIDSGICTIKELDKFLAAATHYTDQVTAEIKVQHEAAMTDKDHPQE